MSLPEKPKWNKMMVHDSVEVSKALRWEFFSCLLALVMGLMIGYRHIIGYSIIVKTTSDQM